MKESLDRFIPVVELAEMAGTRRGSVYSWVMKNSRVQQRRRAGRRLYVHLTIADRYLERYLVERQPRRPKGWLSTEQAAERIGVSTTSLKQLIRDEPESVEAVVVGGSYFFEPEGVARAQLERSDARPLPGWTALRDLAAELGKDPGALRKVAVRAGLTLRLFSYQQRQALFTDDAGVKLIREWAAQTVSAAQRRRLTDDDVRSIRERVTAGERQSDLATEYGVSRRLINDAVHYRTYKTVE